MAGTGNPVPSDAIADLKANAETLDQFISSTDASAITRTGKNIKTIAGVEQDADALLSTKKSEFDNAIQSTGWFVVGNFADGFTYTAYNQVGRDSTGQMWSYNGSLPFTVAAGVVPSEPDYTNRGDATLRSALASGVDTGEGGLNVSGSVIYTDDVAEMQSIPTSEIPDGQAVKTISEGRTYKWNAATASFDWVAHDLVRTGPRSYAIELNDNQIDPDAGQSILLTGGGQPSYLGVQNAIPIGGTYPWPGPSDYSQNTSGASISTIVGGYDNVNNGYASHIFGGLHAYIDASQEGHCLIAGGSNNYIGPDAARGSIIGSQSSGIESLSNNNQIIGGLDIKMEAGTREINSVVGGRGHRTTSGRRSTLLGGENNQLTPPPALTSADDGAVVGGVGNELSAPRSVILGGSGNHVTHQDVVAAGWNVKTISSGNYYGTDWIDERGDAQNFRVTAKAVTGTSATFMTFPGNVTGTEGRIVLPVTSVIGGVITLIGMRDGSATGANDGDFSQATCRQEFTAYRGSDGVLVAKEGSTNAVTTSQSSINLDRITHNNHSLVTASSPQLFLYNSNGLLRILAPPATDNARIKWVATFDITMTRLS